MINFQTLLGESNNRQTKKEIVSKNKYHNENPWVEKYRPKRLDDIVSQHDIVAMLKKTLTSGELPHLLLYGPAGVGKTSTILAIAKELFGPKIYKERIIELNASDERGINVVRNKIVNFAKTAISEKDPNYTCPPYKIIILDEADAMTTEAQAALRKPIEEYSGITRFCFICNYIKEIIDPIASRCVKFRFKPLDDNNIINKLKSISVKEGMNLNKSTLKVLSDVSNGDLRKAIMSLQNLKYLHNGDISKITPSDVYIMANYISDTQLNKIKKICITDKSYNINKIVKLTKHIKNQSYPISNIIKRIHDLLVDDNTLSDNKKATISLHLSNTEKRLLDGADEYIQLLSIFMNIKNVVLH